MTTAEEDLEKLIRTIGQGYHPDTPYDGYEPPITQYTREEWDAIHNRFHDQCSQDIYGFGLDIFHKMAEERGEFLAIVFPDGSRSDQVVMEEIKEQLSFLDEIARDVLREVLNWSDASRAALQEALGS